MRVCLAEGDELGEIGIFLAVDEGIEVFQVRDALAYFLHLVHDSHALQHDHLGVAVVEDVAVVLLADGGIDRHGDAAYLDDGHVEDVPFGTVAADEGHLVAGLDAEFDEGVAGLASQVLVFGRAVLAPLSVFFSCQSDLLFRPFFGIHRKDVKNAGFFTHDAFVCLYFDVQRNGHFLLWNE